MERLVFGRPSAIAPGDPVPSNWTEGWAALPGFGDCAHYFRRDVPRVCSVDGVLTLITPVTTACGHGRFELKTSALMEVGAFPKCLRCARGESK
jgi:hypothetical protein